LFDSNIELLRRVLMVIADQGYLLDSTIPFHEKATPVKIKKIVKMFQSIGQHIQSMVVFFILRNLARKNKDIACVFIALVPDFMRGLWRDERHLSLAQHNRIRTLLAHGY